MNTTLRISFWQITLDLIVALPFACFGILGIVSIITDGGLFMLLSPFGWFFSAFFIISVWQLFLAMRIILTPNWIEIGNDGIRYHTLFSLRKTFVAWQDIDDFYVRSVSNGNGAGGKNYYLYYFLKQDPIPPPKYFWQRKKKIKIPLADNINGGMYVVIEAICKHCPLSRLTSRMSPYHYL